MTDEHESRDLGFFGGDFDGTEVPEAAEVRQAPDPGDPPAVRDEHALSSHFDAGYDGPSRSRRLRGCLGILFVLGAVGLVLVVAVVFSIDKVQGLFAGPDDYSGSSGKQVYFEVHDGDSATAIGRNLAAAGIVASAESFTDAASANPDSRGIQVGFYALRSKMSADEALKVLVNPDNLVQDVVTVPEGLRLDKALAILAKKTGIPEAKFSAALQNPSALGLPAYAQGNAEGYLFPATYGFPPNATAASILKTMVGKFDETASGLKLAATARAKNISPHDAVTVASIIEREVRRNQDLAGVAEVIYNRLNGKCPDSGRLLQMDSTVHYAAGENESVFTSAQMRAIDSPYNTYKYPGLPPGPIASPGEAAIKAALNPSKAGYCYFVATNLETGETAFARTAAEHAANIAKLAQYCRESDLC